MASLFDPLRLRGVTLRNRIGMSPMVQTSSVDGFATDWHLVHLGSRAVGGAALVMTEATAVEERGRISINDLGIWKDEHIAQLARIASFVRGEGAVPGIQLGHGGRKGSYAPPFDKNGIRSLRQLADEEGAWPVVGASPIPFDSDSPVPHEMTVPEIRTVVDAYGAAALRAEQAGFDWLEVHAAHGYLPHCFYSPLSNKRSDEYGGSFENRIRFTLEVAAAIRNVIDDSKVLAFRLSHTDWVEGGWTTEETVTLARRLKSAGVDLIDVSSGGSTAKTVALMRQLRHDEVGQRTPSARAKERVAEIPLGPGYQVPGAIAIRTGADIPVAAVGMITAPRQADDIIRNEQADLIMLARALLRDPYWPQRAAIELGATARMRVPVQYYLAWKDEGDFVYRPVSAPVLSE